MNHERSLIILIPGFPENEADSTCLPSHQAFVRSINRNFPELKLHIISFQYPFKKSNYQWNENNIYAFGGRNRGGIPRVFLWNRVANKLSRLKKENNIIGVLSFWAGECALVGQRWAKRNGIKHVCLLMGQDAKKENQYLKRIKPKSENLVSISDFNAEELFMNHGIKPAQVIPLGIEPEIFSSQHFKRDIDILCAGSLIPLKQFDMAIEVAKELTRTHSLLRMVICGTGPEEKKLHSLIKENKLEGNVKLIGEKKYAETIQLMEISRLFLHPSNYEGFSGVCIEARGAGTPVVSFIKPMNEDIPGWHIVNSRDEMIKECGRILQSNADPQPVFPFTSDDASKRFIDLFR